MSAVANRTYRISWRSGLVTSTAVIFSLLLALSWPWGAWVVVPALGLALVATLLVPAVTVREDGISLYGVNHLRWGEVAAVRATHLLGLPYAVVHRHKGIRWWVPLYVDDRRGLLAALASTAPVGSPFHTFAAAGAN